MEMIIKSSDLPIKRLVEEILLYEDAVISPWIFRKTSTYTRNYTKGVMTPLFGTIDVTKAYTVNRAK